MIKALPDRRTIMNDMKRFPLVAIVAVIGIVFVFMGIALQINQYQKEKSEVHEKAVIQVESGIKGLAL